MSSEKGSSASKGGMSNKSAQSSAVVQGIKADQYAKQKLGITGGTVMNTPAGHQLDLNHLLAQIKCMVLNIKQLEMNI